MTTRAGTALALQTVPSVDGLRLARSERYVDLLRNMVEAAHCGGLPAVGYAPASAGKVMWALVLACGMTGRLIPFPAVSWREMFLQEACVGWLCTWHTPLGGIDM